MVQPVMPKQNLPIVPYQEVLGRPQLGHVLSRDLGSYHILVQLLQVGGELVWDLGKK